MIIYQCWDQNESILVKRGHSSESWFTFRDYRTLLVTRRNPSDIWHSLVQSFIIMCLTPSSPPQLLMTWFGFCVFSCSCSHLPWFWCVSIFPPSPCCFARWSQKYEGTNETRLTGACGNTVLVETELPKKHQEGKVLISKHWLQLFNVVFLKRAHVPPAADAYQFEFLVQFRHQPYCNMFYMFEGLRHVAIRLYRRCMRVVV